MSTFQSFTIRCSRDILSAEHDDIITIKPRWNELAEDMKMMEFVVHHHIAPCASPTGSSDKSKQVLVGSAIRNYVENLIDFLAIDIQPFLQIQFDFPCMPTILVTPKQLPDIHEAIMSAVYEIQDSWPVMIVKHNKKVSTQSLNPYADSYIPESYRTPERAASHSAPPPRVEPRVPRHIFFDEEDGHVTRYFH